MDQEDVAYTYGEMLLNHKKWEWNSSICSRGDVLENIMLCEVSQTKINTVWFYLYVESKKEYKLEREDKMAEE